MTLTELRDYVSGAETWVRALADLPESSPENDAAIDAGLDEIESRRTELAALEAREARLEQVRNQTTDHAKGVHEFQVIRPTEEVRDVRGLTNGEVRDAAMRVVESRSKEANLSPAQLDDLDKTLRTNTPNRSARQIAERTVLTENDAYHSAWMKGITGKERLLNNEERQALQDFEDFQSRTGESRDMVEGTTTAGGYGIPVLIDPTIILSAQVMAAPLLGISRIETITTNIWKGVTSAGVTWSYDAEGSAVSDDSATLAQPAVTAYMSRGFIPASIELIEDYPSFISEVSMLLGSGYVDLLASKTAVGSGSSEPKGVFTAITASAGACVSGTTSGVLQSSEVTAIYEAVPERFRNRASWFSHVATQDKIRLLGTATTAGSFTVDLAQPEMPRLMGKQLVASDYAPKQATSTATNTGFLLVGDFSQFVIVQRAGMSIEYVPTLFDTTSNRPIGERGWFAWSRNGCDVSTTNAFRCLINGTH